MLKKSFKIYSLIKMVRFWVIEENSSVEIAMYLCLYSLANFTIHGDKSQ